MCPVLGMAQSHGRTAAATSGCLAVAASTLSEHPAFSMIFGNSMAASGRGSMDPTSSIRPGFMARREWHRHPMRLEHDGTRCHGLMAADIFGFSTESVLI